MHVRRALALALVVPLLLAGCTEDEPEPILPDPPTTSSTPTPTDTGTPEAESAEDFVRRFFEADNDMQRTGDVEPFLALSQNCASCKEIADLVKGIYSAGGRVEVGGIVVNRVDVVGTLDDGGTSVTTVRVRATSRPGFYVPEQGAPRKELAGGPSIYKMELEEHPDGGWLVRTWTERGN